MPPRDLALRIADILDSIGRIERYTAGMTFDAFEADEKTTDAVLWNFQVIGEAARHVPAEVSARFPGIPWAEMCGMRNVIVHQYFGVDLEIVWQTIRDRLPPLVAALHRLLDEEQ
ncbi:MAG TPA: DUF86 domain-containing protein [Longimicrobiaceae bacterium]|nr:DUF86 domain-containing protein [Longimicrobiaceae bacterium]